MESSNETTTGEVTQVNEVTATSPRKVNVMEFFSKTSIVQHEGIEVDPQQFTKFVGGLLDKKQATFLNERKNKISFIIPDGTAKGLQVIVPNETANSDSLTRIMKTFSDVTKQMFADFQLEEITPNETHKAILQSLHVAGIKFSSFSKAGVNSGLRTWISNKRLKIAAVVERTKRLNLRTECENYVMRTELSTARKVTKSQRDKFLPDVQQQLADYLNS